MILLDFRISVTCLVNFVFTNGSPPTVCYDVKIGTTSLQDRCLTLDFQISRQNFGIEVPNYTMNLSSPCSADHFDTHYMHVS